MHYYPGEHWYAIRVRSRFEAIIEKCLGQKHIESLHLTYNVLSKRKDRKKLLTKAFFPGYMFIKSELNPEVHVEILKSMGVIEVLKNSQGPLPIPENQIGNVLKLEKYEGQITTFDEFAMGMAVRIIQGPLLGVEGFVDEINRDLVKISIDSIPGSVAIQVAPYQIEQVHPNRSFASVFR
jgi:transcription antitermination factor NusG